MTKQISSVILLLILITSCTETPELVQIENPTGIGSSLPRLFTDNSGVIFLSWVEQSQDTASLYYSKYNDETWSAPELISSSTKWFVNWADFPSVIGENGSAVAAHWLGKIPGNTYSYNVEISTKLNAANWNQSIIPHTDNTPTEHGFVSMVPFSDSSFYAIWLDGRNTSGGHVEHGDLSTAMTLRGAEISYTGDLILEHELDKSVCDCCNTSLVKTEDGLIAMYRNRTEEEIRDIYVKKYVDGIWREEKPLHEDNWNIAACPVNGAAVDYKDNLTAASWFTGANDNAMVKLAFSEDKGETFREPFLVDASVNLGRVDVVINDESSAWVSWISRSEDTGTLNVQLISTEGKVLQSHEIAEIDPSRRSGFPQITPIEKGVLIAWTNISDQAKKVNTAILR